MSKKTPLYRLGTVVQTTDRRAQEHQRRPDRREDIGAIADYYRPSYEGPKAKRPPYLVMFEDGTVQWFDADEVEPLRKRR
jgi:hypothetical protein